MTLPGVGNEPFGNEPFGDSLKGNHRTWMVSVGVNSFPREPARVLKPVDVSSRNSCLCPEIGSFRVWGIHCGLFGVSGWGYHPWAWFSMVLIPPTNMEVHCWPLSRRKSGLSTNTCALPWNPRVGPHPTKPHPSRNPPHRTPPGLVFLCPTCLLHLADHPSRTARHGLRRVAETGALPRASLSKSRGRRRRRHRFWWSWYSRFRWLKTSSFFVFVCVCVCGVGHFLSGASRGKQTGKPF